MPATLGFPWGMVYQEEAEPAAAGVQARVEAPAAEVEAEPSTSTEPPNLNTFYSGLTLYCPVMAMPSSELEDNPMRFCGLSLDQLQDPLIHLMLPPQGMAKQSKLFEKGALCQRIHAGFLC